MPSIWIPGKQRVEGVVKVQGCKNAVLPMMAAALLTDDEVVLQNCPDILDVRNMMEILSILGCRVELNEGVLQIRNGLSASLEIPQSIIARLRASGLLLGAYAGSGKTIRLPRTGGCVIGERPMDLHLYALRSLGYTVVETAEYTEICGNENVHAAKIRLAYPSVGATENAMLASVLISDDTEILGAAREPEIEDLAAMLNSMGARIMGAGEECIRIQGVKRLHGTVYTVMSDRIVAGTYLSAAAATDGNLLLQSVEAEHLESFLRVLRSMGYRIDKENGRVRIRPSGYKVPASVKTGPYPQFPTDLQPLMMPLMLTIQGMSVIRETVFENRMAVAGELCRMGASIKTDGCKAILYGSALKAERVTAPDLRGGAALAVAALTAEGVTEIRCAERIARGYEDIVKDLNHMGVRCYYQE